MAFINAKTGKQVKLEKGYLSNPVDYQTFVKQQEAKRRSAASASSAARAADVSNLDTSARPSTVSLQNQLRQAQADLDTDAVMRINRQLKEERARQGKQTVRDRVSDVFSAALGGSGGSLANLVGFASNLARDPAADRRQINRLQESLKTGRTTDGKPITDVQRKTIQESISRLDAAAKGKEAPESFTNRAYAAADRMADTGAAFQESAKKGLGKVGSTVVDAAVSMGQSTLDAALGAATGTGMLPFVARSFGGAAQEARRGGADLDEQLKYGSAQAAKEFVTEKLFGLSAPQRLIGGGSLDDAIETGIRKVTERLAKTPGGQKFVGGLMTWLAGGATEGLEEGIGSLIENTLINPNLRDWDPDTRSRQQKFEDGLYDMLVGGVSGLMGVTNLGAYQVSPAVRAQAAAREASGDADAHVRGTLEMMQRAAGLETAQEAAQTGQGARLGAGLGTDTPAAQNAATAAQTGPENIFTQTADAIREEGDRQVRGTLEMMQRAAGVETGTAQQETAPGTGAAVNENGLTALSRLERENLSSGKRNKVISTFSEAVNFVKNAIRNKQIIDRAYLGKIPDSVVDTVRKETGIDIRGFGAMFNGVDIRHIINEHGDPIMEAARGQIAVTPEDIARIPEVLSSPDRVYLSKALDGKGRKAIVFEKTIGNKMITFQGVSNGKKLLQTDTLYIKTKNPQDAVSHADAAAPTRDTNVQNVPPQGPSFDPTIQQSAPEVKPSGTDGLGAADAGSLNSDYDRLQAQSARFHPEGENAARPVDVPVQDFEGRNISKAASTVMGAKAIPDGVIPMIEQMVAEGRMSYDRVSDAASTARARARIQEIGFQGALAEYREAVRSGKASKDLSTLGATLLNNAANAGDGNAMAELLMLYQADTTNVAQAQQARSVLRKLSPESQLYGIQRTISELNKNNERKNQGRSVTADDAAAAYEAVSEALQEARRDLETVTAAYGNVVDTMRYAYAEEAGSKKESPRWVEKLGAELASSAARRAQPAKQKQPTVYETMLRELNTFMAEHVKRPEGPKSRQTASDIIADALANRQEYAAAWQTAQANLLEKYADNPAMLEALRAFNETSPLFGGTGPDTTMMKAVAEAALENDVTVKNLVIRSEYDAEALTNQISDTLIQRTGANTDTDRAVIREAVQRYILRKTENAGKYAFEYIGSDIQKTMRDLGLRMSGIIKSSPGDKANAANQIADMLVTQYGVSEAAAGDVAAAVVNDFQRSVKEASREKLEQMFRDRPKRVQKTLMERFDELVNLGAFSENEFSQKAAQKLFGVQGDITISQELIQNFLNQTDQEGRNAVMEEILQDAANQLPGSWRGIFDSMRYLSMLFNPRTHWKNFLGNFAFQIPASVKNRVGAALEMGAKSAGADIERTKSLSGANPFGTLAREARADWKNAKPFLEGGHYNEGKLTASDIQKLASPFKNVRHMQWAATLLENTLGRLSNWNMNALEVEDAIFKRFIYSQSLAGYLQANGVKSIDQADPGLLNRARNYAAQEALRNTFNDKNVVSDAVSSIGKLRNSENQVLRGLSYFTEGALPFKRTPANVAVRAVEYSPVGGVAEIFKTVYDGATGKATAESVSKRIDRIAAGVSGTALFSLGWLLAAAGYLRGGGGDDKDQRNFDDLTGHQKYALELDNGTSITLDWTAPSAIPLFMGVEASKALEDGNLTTDDAVRLLKNMSEPMLQMSMLQGINDLFESAAYAKDRDENVIAALATQAAFGYLSQAIPTLGGQMERIPEDKRMTTYADKNSPLPQDAQFFLGKLSQKVPGWDYNQIPYLDAWGREEETGDPVERVFNNFFNPSYVSQIQVDQVEQELQRVKDATGDGDVFPTRADRYFTVNKERKDLTAEEYQTYAKKRGQTSMEVLQSMIKSPGYQKLGEEKKAEAISYVYSYADAIGKMAVSDYRPGDGTIAAGALKTMLPPADYILYRMNKDRDGDGKVTNLESTQTLQELPDLSGKQRGEAWAAMNAKANPARNPFTGTLAKEDMTPEESATAWDIYGRSGTKEEPYTKKQKKQDLREELDLTAQEVNRLWNLMVKAAERK